MLLTEEEELFITGVKDHFATSVAGLAETDLYGLKNCKETWGNAMRKLLIFGLFDCDGINTLNNTEVDCLKGKLSENLTINCC